MAKIIVEVGKQMDGVTFRLSPQTRALLSPRFRSEQVPASIFVSYETKSDFEHFHGPLCEHVVMILTGLNEQQLTNFGGFRFVTPTDDKVLFDSHALQ